MGTCDCASEGDYPCNKCHPSDIYNMLNTKPHLCELMGIHTIQDADDFIMKTYKSECWPERLKKDLDNDTPE